MIQGSDEWFAARVGRVTASRIADVMAKIRSGGYGAGRANYMAQLIAERLTREPAASFSSAAMQWGTETEPQARAAYEFYSDVSVKEVGFIDHPLLDNSGASPDGMVGDNGLLEIKCPNTATHIDTLLAMKIPGKYILQMQWQMACTGRSWCDFVSFDPRMPEHLTYFCHRINRDDEKIDEIMGEVRTFLLEMDLKISRLEKLAV